MSTEINKDKETVYSLFKRTGERILQSKTDKGINRYHLAKLTGISYSTLLGYERGTNDPSVSKLTKIAEALEVSLDWLAGREKFSGSSSSVSPVAFTLSSNNPKMPTLAGEEYRAVPILSLPGILKEHEKTEERDVKEYSVISNSQLMGRTDVVGFRLTRDQKNPVPACLPPPATLFIDRQDKKISPKGIYAVRIERNKLAFGRLHWTSPHLTCFSALSEEYFTSITVRPGEQPGDHIIGRVILSLQSHI